MRTEPPCRVKWAQVPGMDFLWISNRGEVKRRHMLKNGMKDVPIKRVERHRSIMVLVKIKGKVRQFSVASLLAKAFYDEDADSSNLKFIDGDKSNITTTNTEYVSSSTGRSLQQKPKHRNITYRKESDGYIVRFMRNGRRYYSKLIYDLDEAIRIRDRVIAKVDAREAKKDKAEKILKRKYKDFYRV